MRGHREIRGRGIDPDHRGQFTSPTVTAYARPTYFAYRTDNYTFALKFIATGAKGQWWFNPDSEVTYIKWRYEFTAKGRVTAVLLSLFVRTQWAGYMRVCLENTRRYLRMPAMGHTSSKHYSGQRCSVSLRCRLMADFVAEVGGDTRVAVVTNFLK